ncbi:trichohyalin isoform X2 [Hetaerina americana]|uniref:trichohyalin isoform X2 n=1 Tax=Hetaerina americana TaxID=62018 RepID=UPI003A7F5682
MSGGGTRGMQHLYTGAKGDPLCPLGFHPQVRWPTRCKRCFRDYKDHGGAKREETSLRKDETTLSSPLLSSNQSSTSSSRFRDGLSSDAGGSRGWNSPSLSSRLPPGRTSASSWTSTPDLQSLSSDTTSKDTTSATVRLRLPSSTSPSTSSSTQTYSSLKPPIPPSSSSSTSTASKSSSASSDSEGDKVLDWLQRYHERRRVGESAQTALNSSYSPPSKTSESSTPLRSRRLLVQEVKTVDNTPKESSKETTAGVNPDVEFIIRVKSSASKAKEKEKEKANAEKDSESDDDDSSVAATETTDTTLVGAQGEKSFNEEEMESLRQELAELRTRCEKAEREKNDILLRRVTTASRTSSSELLRLQQKVNELSSVKEKLEEEKRSLNLKVNELTEEVEKSKVKKKKKKKLSETSAAAIAIRRRRALLAGRSFNEDDEDDDDEDDEETKRAIEDLKNKLTAAEQLCEELMDENSEMKKEIRELEEEMEEMQDNFREDQVDEYTSLKKELEQTAKNCRILQFKLRKAERRAETLETERNEAVARSGSGATEAQKKLEHDLSLANQVALRLQSEVESLQEKLKASEEGKKKFGLKVDEVPKRAPKLAAIAKSSSGERPTRESLTRGGSQEDPVQLLRDLQDSMEREADLREQLRFAEEEAQNLRKTLSRVEDDNESLVAQLKRMAAKSRSTRKQSPSPARLTPEPSLEKDEGISEDDDPAELRLQLELNEQETAVLRRKVEELEKEGETTKKKMKELQDKLAEKKTVPAKTIIPAGTGSAKGSAISEQKIKVLEEEANELRRKLIEKERDCERLNAELTLTQKRSKGLMQRSRSLDSGGGAPLDQATLDLKRQLQVVEQEANILRSKTQELEAECERVTAENKKLSLSKAAAGKRTTEIKTLRERVKELEAKLGTSEGVKSGEGESKESSKDKKESPESMSSSDVEALKIKLEKAEAEVEQLTSELNKAKDPKSALLRKRTAKRPTDLTPRLQLKKMVEELEIEIAELLVVLKNTDAEKEKLSTELKKSSAGEKEALEKEREQWENDKKEKEKFAKELEEIKAKLTTAEKELKKVQGEKLGAEEETKKKKDEEIRKLKEGKNKIEADLKKIEKEKSELQSELQKIKTEKDSTSSKWEDELKDMIERMDKLRKEVEVERASCEEAKTKLDEAKETAQREKSQMEKEVTDKTKKLAENEKKTKEIEEKLKKIERIGLTRKEKISKLEKEVQEEREKVKQLEGRQKEVSAGWLKEREELKKVSEEAQIKVAELESQITLLEESVKDEQKKTQDLQQQVGRSKEESDVIKGLQDELIDLKKKLEESNESLEKSEKQRKVNEEKLKKAEAEIKKDKGKAREDHLKEIEKLEQQLAHEKQEYDDLTTKYEMLEEDYVVTKAQLVSEKEAAESQLLVAKHEMDNLDEELETLRDSYNSKQDMWIKEKIDLQECLKEAEEKASRAATSNDSWTMERSRLRDSLEEKTKETEKLRREAEVISDQINHLRRENEELKSKLEDFDKVAKIQRSMAADTSALEKQLREAKNNLSLEEKNHKAEVSTLKMRYDNRISLLSEELESSQNTAARFRRERDAQRHLLEAAQKSMAELRKSAASRTKGSESPADDMGEDAAGRIATLEQEVACLEDELSEARLDKSRLKTELVNERSAWEVKIAEMQSRVNELEEDRILSSGRTRVAGVRTRMELAWHKEREEQHRLLQETTTLARDLRQTLFEVERERDKERLEAKKKAEQLKRSMEEEQEENKKKLIELQNDLLELRDAHAKLRTTNEKLRRDREKLQERIEREREETRIGMASRKKNKMDEEKKVIALLDQVDALMKLAPELFPQQQRPSQDRPSPSPMLTTAAPTTPLIPKRTKGPRSRENSPILERKELRREGSVTSLNAEEEKRGHQLQWALQRLTEATEELRRSHRQGLDEERDGSISSSSRRGIGMRRAASTESEPDESTRKKSSTLSRLGAPGSAAKKKGSLIRKSISLEQTSGHAASSASEQSIWKMDADGSTGSLQSIEAASEILDDRYPSLDRLSAGSTQSEIGTTKKKKTGIFGKLKKLTKSKSIDEGNLRDYDGSTQGGSVIGSGSDISVGTEELEERGRGKDLKGKLSGLFKKSGSRSSSMERGSSEKVGPMSSATSDHGASPAQRPLSRTALSRPSPARSDSSHTSSTSRPLTASATPRAVISRK